MNGRIIGFPRRRQDLGISLTRYADLVGKRLRLYQHEVPEKMHGAAALIAVPRRFLQELK